MSVGIKVGSINFRNRHQPSHHTSDKRGISFFRKWGNIICFLHERINAALSSGKPQKSHTSGHYVYGLRGIQQLFGVSHKTAQEYKDGIIKDAVRQNGRKIVVDADLALELFNKKKNSHD